MVLLRSVPLPLPFRVKLGSSRVARVPRSHPRPVSPASGTCHLHAEGVAPLGQTVPEPPAREDSRRRINDTMDTVTNLGGKSLGLGPPPPISYPHEQEGQRLAPVRVTPRAVDVDRQRMAKPTLLEAAFPIRELSLIVAADRRAKDPVYCAHRWWARRPPAVLRALLLATLADATTPLKRFWDLYAGEGRPLAGLRVLDPFVGGGSTLVEAARLGADVVGGDVDPLAVHIVRHELKPPGAKEVQEAGAALLETLRTKVGQLYPEAAGAQPLHYFYLAVVTCPNCGHAGPLYRNLVLAHDTGRVGAVVRNNPLTVFCPSNYCLHEITDARRVRLHCCGTYHGIYHGTFSNQAYTCPMCSHTASHRELSTGIAPRRLLAVEETKNGTRRSLRYPSESDASALRAARELWADHGDSLPHPRGPLPNGRRDDRPFSYGVQRVEQLFTDRQLLLFGHALQWLADQELPAAVDRALRLAVSNALTTNNRLCGYATEYGRLSALFAIRGYSLPALPVELNPLHPTAGRGTLPACIRRVVKASAETVRRYVWSISDKRAVPRHLSLTTEGVSVDVACRTADEAPADHERSTVDLCIFDPPYFDYIAYDELSQFHRAWQPHSTLAGKPLIPENGDGAQTFGLRLAKALRAALVRLRPGRPLAFTYHSTNWDAWEAVGIALDQARLAVTALWPIRCDGHMGHHSHEGNCEWDLIIVCRPLEDTVQETIPWSVNAWIRELMPLKVKDADRTSMQLALDIAAPRFGALNKGDRD